jgi:hypothetical protein
VEAAVAAEIPGASTAKDTGQHKGAIAPAAAEKQGTAGSSGNGTVVGDTGLKKESAAQAAFGKKGAHAAARKEAPAAVKHGNSKDVMNAVLEYQRKTELASSDIKKEQLEVQKLKMKADDLDEQIRKVREETELLKKKPDQQQKPVEKQQPEEKKKPEANQKFDEKPKPK